jgi:hypothetical protein
VIKNGAGNRERCRPPFPRRGLRPRALLMALLSPILSCMSRLHSTALRLAPRRVGGAAAPPWARGSIRGEGWLSAGALGPGIAKVLRQLMHLGPIERCRKPATEGQHPSCPGRARILAAPIRRRRQPRHALPAPRRFAAAGFPPRLGTTAAPALRTAAASGS